MPLPVKVLQKGFVDLFSDRESALWRPLTELNDRARKLENKPPLIEVFSGADVTENQYGFYSGGVTGALGPHLNLKGLRLRAVYGQGRYQYRSKRQVGPSQVETLFLGDSEFYEAMVGYEFRFADVIFKAYGGVVHEINHIDPTDVNNQLEGEETGGKLLLEVWRDFEKELGARYWFSGYGSYTTGSEYYTVHGRVGMPVNSLLTVGLETGVFGNKEFDALRLGAFGKLKIGTGELTFSGGVSGDYEQPDALYGTVQYFTKLYKPE